MKRAIRVSLHFDVVIPDDIEGDYEVIIKRNKMQIVDSDKVIVQSGEFVAEVLDYQSLDGGDDF